MNRFAALLLSAFVLGSAGDVKLRVIVDATSPGAYNRWVWQHKAERPRFPTVYITWDGMRQRGEYVWPAVSFWTDSGPLLTHRILPDSQPVALQMAPVCLISRDFDQLTVRSGINELAVYDKFGSKLFVDPHRERLAPGRWERHVLDPSPRTVLLDDSGKVLSTISSSGRVRRILYTSDSVFALDADSTVVLFDRNGRVLWRSHRLQSPFAAAIADNGCAVAAATNDSLVIYSSAHARTVMLPHDGEWERFGGPIMAWSADGQRLAIYQGSKSSWDSGRVFVVNTEGRLVRPARNMRLYNVRALLWMGDTLVFPALNVDVSHRDPRFNYSVSADSYVISFLPPRGDASRGTIHGKFDLHGTWIVSGQHLAYMTDGRYLIAECVR